MGLKTRVCCRLDRVLGEFSRQCAACLRGELCGRAVWGCRSSVGQRASRAASCSTRGGEPGRCPHHHRRRRPARRAGLHRL